MSAIKEAALASLYEYLLTAEADAYWFFFKDVREQINPPPSGALLHIALQSLKDEGLVDITFEGEEDLFTLTPQGIEKAEKIHSKFHSGEPQVLDVATQKARIEAIRKALEEIENELRGNNEIGEERDLFAGELAAARVLAGRDKFRLARLIALIIPMLRYLADKFAGSAIGELAKQLTKLLLG
jgi:DNA-binding PadR family transcriptional regulator